MKYLVEFTYHYSDGVVEAETQYFRKIKDIEFYTTNAKYYHPKVTINCYEINKELSKRLNNE